MVRPQWYVDAEEREYRLKNIARNKRAAEEFLRKRPAEVARAPALAAALEKSGLLGAAKLVAFLASPEGTVLVVGSSSVGLLEILHGKERRIPFFSAAMLAVAPGLRLGELHFGSIARAVTPIEDLERLFPVISLSPPHERKWFDGFCAELMGIRDPEFVIGSVTFGEDGTRVVSGTVPAGFFRKKIVRGSYVPATE